MNIKDIHEKQNAWLSRYGIVDKDDIAMKNQERKKFKSKTEIEKMKIDATLDLHGLTQDEAWNRIDTFVSSCERQNFKKIAIIHGKDLHSKGESVLGDLVKKFIQIDKRLGTSSLSLAQNGGSGVTWVILKNNIYK